jgi:SAM-dependent methyltransferase
MPVAADQSTYYLPPGYRRNLSVEQAPLAAYTAPPPHFAYQAAVYQYAAAIAHRRTHPTVLDVGCGSGKKLTTYFGRGDLTGIDAPVCIDACRRILQGKDRRWLVEDLDGTDTTLTDTFDVIICADVIEHLVYPDRLLRKIAKWATPETDIVLSTPERSRYPRPDNAPTGPPTNPLHVQEWNRGELAALVTSAGFHIHQHRLVDARSLTLRERLSAWRHWTRIRTCQMLHLRIR